MNSSQNKFIKRKYHQPSIMSAVNNLKKLSQNQKKRKEDLSKSIIEIHSSDSEIEEIQKGNNRKYLM